MNLQTVFVLFCFLLLLFLKKRDSFWMYWEQMWICVEYILLFSFSLQKFVLKNKIRHLMQELENVKEVFKYQDSYIAVCMLGPYFQTCVQNLLGVFFFSFFLIMWKLRSPVLRIEGLAPDQGWSHASFLAEFQPWFAALTGGMYSDFTFSQIPAFKWMQFASFDCSQDTFSSLDACC